MCKVTVFFDAMWSTSPEPVEPAGGGPGVVDGVPGITMTQIILDETQIVAPVGEIIAARMAQHVRPDRRKAGTGRSGGHDPTWTAGPDFAIENGGNAGG